LWILEKEELPPIRFQTLINELKIPSDLKARIEELIRFKATTREKHIHHGENDLLEFIRYCINKGANEACLLKGSNGQLKDLNRLFTKTLGC
jgi:predicted nucleotidyltransferase